MKNPKSKIQNPKSPRGFTLTELLVVMLVLSILAGLTVAALAGAVNDARASRTRAVINKIDLLIDERWESYRTRAVPLRIPATNHPDHALFAARIRLLALRELMRMELPDRITDVTTGSYMIPAPVNLPLLPQSSVKQSYLRLANRATNGTIANWTTTHQGSECLYLILSTMKDNDKSALDYFSTDEIGDVDGDGMKEILDGWGRPIEFLRWAPGYSQHPGPDGGWGVSSTDDDGNGTADDIFEAGWPGSDDIIPVTTQTRVAVKHPTLTNIPFAPDPYDPVRVDPRVCKVDVPRGANPPVPTFFQWLTSVADTATDNDTFALKPLIFSAGIDGTYDVNTQGGLVYNSTSPPNDPYYIDSVTQLQAGMVYNATVTGGDIDGDGNPRGWADNITNHDNTAQ
jgi:prepilin-type N-terminal cleavage/methylation domain-containing protein